MNKKLFFFISPWTYFSKKLEQRLSNPKHAGIFTTEEAEARGMHLAIGQDGKVEEGRAVCFYWLVDASDGVIVDVRFQVFGPPSLIAAAEAASMVLMRKNYDQARRISTDLLDKQMGDKTDQTAFPSEAAADLNLVLSVIERTAEQCTDIPFAETYITTPLSAEETGEGERREHPGWDKLVTKQKIAVIEEVIAQEIRPYIELDAGGVQVLNLLDDREVIIKYEGSCTTCYSATGSTLSAIQQILQTRVHPSLFVTPDLTAP